MFGDKKRIKELQESINLLRVRIRLLEKFSTSTISPCKCESCGINTNGETNGTYTVFGHSVPIKTQIKISAAKAIEKIMDHLGLEFDHIEATNPDTVITPKETP